MKPQGTLPLHSLHGGHTTTGDGKSSATAMVEAAVAVGMDLFGVSEHFYRPREERFRYEHEEPGHDFGRAGWPAHAEEMLALRSGALADGRCRILFGAEVEYLPGYEAWTREELARWPLDYTVLSVHFLEIRGNVVPFDASPRDWQRALALCGGQVALYCCYYEHVLQALEWGVGDVLGHLDVIKVFAEQGVEDPSIDRLIDEVLARCAERDLVLDLNARGLIKPCGEVYPSRSILARAHRAGVKVVLGDDSHAPEQVGLNLDRAVAAARAGGLSRLCLPPRLGGQCWDL